MAAKLILVGAFLLAAAFAQDGQTGRGRGFLPRRLASRDRGPSETEQPPARPVRPAQDDEAVLERRRLLLKNTLRRRRPFSTVQPTEEKEDEVRATPTTVRPKKLRLPNKESQGNLLNDIPNVDSPVEKLSADPEIRDAILGKSEIVRVSFKSDATTVPPTTPAIQPLSTRRTNKLFRKFRPALVSRRQQGEGRPAPTERDDATDAAQPAKPNTDKPVRGGLPFRRRIAIKKNKSEGEAPRKPAGFKGRRRFGRPTSERPTTASPTTSTKTTTTTTASTTYFPVRVESTASPLQIKPTNRKFEEKNADAALQALLKTAAEPEPTTRRPPTLPPVTEALEDVRKANNEEEAALLEMKEDIRNIIPRVKSTTERTNVRSSFRSRGGLRRPSAAKAASGKTSDSRFRSFPAQRLRQRGQATRVNPFPGREESPRSLSATQPRKSVNQVDRQLDQDQKVVTAPSPAPVPIEQSTTTELPRPAPVTRQPRPTTPTRIVGRPTASSASIPNIPAVFKDLDLPTPTASFGFSTADESVTPVTFFKTTSQPSRVAQTNAEERFVFTPRQSPTTLAPRRAQVTSAPLVPAAPLQPVQTTQFNENRNSIALLQNNQFATFDAQFGGAVPFSSQAPARSPAPAPAPASASAVQPQTSSRFGGSRPFPQTRLVPTVNRQSAVSSSQATQNVVFGTQVAAPSFSSQPFTAFQSQPVRAQPQQFSVQSQPIRTQPQQFSVQSQPIRTQPQQFSVQSQPITAQPQQFSVQSQPITAQAAQLPTQQFQQQPVQAPSQQNFISLPSGTFTGHPAQDININTGTFSLSTGL